MGRGAPRHLANAAGLSLELLRECRDLDEAELRRYFPSAWRQEERDGAELLSFFCGAHGQVVLRAKEARTQRPHGHILRTRRAGGAAIPLEEWTAQLRADAPDDLRVELS